MNTEVPRAFEIPAGLNARQYRDALCMTNHECADAVHHIDEQPRELTDWEAKFVESNLENISFSGKQKAFIYSLCKKYNV